MKRRCQCVLHTRVYHTSINISTHTPSLRLSSLSPSCQNFKSIKQEENKCFSLTFFLIRQWFSQLVVYQNYLRSFLKNTDAVAPPQMDWIRPCLLCWVSGNWQWDKGWTTHWITIWSLQDSGLALCSRWCPKESLMFGIRNLKSIVWGHFQTSQHFHLACSRKKCPQGWRLSLSSSGKKNITPLILWQVFWQILSFGKRTASLFPQVIFSHSALRKTNES